MATNTVTSYRTIKHRDLQAAIDDIEAQIELLTLGTPINHISYHLVDGGKYYQGVLQHGAVIDNNSLWQKFTEDGIAFSVTTGTLNIGTAETDAFLFRNPAASGKNVRVRDLLTAILESGSNVRGFVRLYAAPTITVEGTALVERKVRTSQTATSIVNTFSLPTISARGTLVNEWTMINFTASPRDLDLGGWVEEGEDVLITIQNSGNNTDCTIFMEWAEVDV